MLRRASQQSIHTWPSPVGSRSLRASSSLGASSSATSEPLHPAVEDAIKDEVDQAVKDSERFWNEGDFTRCAERCVFVVDDLLGPNKPKKLRNACWEQLLSSYINGACALKQLQQYEEAIRLCKEGLRIINRQFASQKQQAVHVLDLLAELCLFQGQVDEAETHVARSLKVKEISFPGGLDSLASSWNLQAQCRLQQGDLEGAKALFRRALAANVEVAGGLEQASSKVAVVLCNYASLVRQQGHLGEAVQLFEKAGAIFEHLDEQEAFGRALVELGATYVGGGVTDRRAMEPLTQAMLVLGTALDSEHPSVQATMRLLSRCKDQTSKADASFAEAPAGDALERLLTTRGSE